MLRKVINSFGLLYMTLNIEYYLFMKIAVRSCTRVHMTFNITTRRI
jgi:hypothetical protein